MMGVLLLTGCDTELVEGSGWIDSWSMTDPLRPEIKNDRLDNHEGSLRIGTYNVHFGENPLDIAAKISGDTHLSEVDIWLLQEIESHSTEEGSRTAKIANALNKNYLYVPARTEDDGTHGLAILSSLPFTRPRHMILPRAEVAINTRTRIAIAVDVTWDTRVINIVNFHLDTRLNPSIRIAQLDPAVRYLDDVALMGGDTNDNGFHWTQNSIPNIPADRALGESAHILDDYFTAMGFDTPSQGVGNTADAIVEEFRLDSIFSRGLQPSRAGVSRIEGSDHFPVWIELSPAE